MQVRLKQMILLPQSIPSCLVLNWHLVFSTSFVLPCCIRDHINLVSAVTLLVTSSRSLSMMYHGSNESHVFKGIFVDEGMRAVVGQKWSWKYLGHLFNRWHSGSKAYQSALWCSFAPSCCLHSTWTWAFLSQWLAVPSHADPWTWLSASAAPLFPFGLLMVPCSDCLRSWFWVITLRFLPLNSKTPLPMRHRRWFTATDGEVWDFPGFSSSRMISDG